MNPRPTASAYRAFLVNHSGRIYFSHVLECETDEQAEAAARTLVGYHGIQLWNGLREIAEFSPVRVAGSSLEASDPNRQAQVIAKDVRFRL
jgi:hypothetical protein